MTNTMGVLVTSSETIKPSRPTPQHRRQFNLSFLDQINRRDFVPFICFYPPPPALDKDFIRATNLKRSRLLKQSLAHFLTTFYPLAGRLRNDLSVDCNDHGVPFLEAQAKFPLSDVVETSDLAQLNVFLPVRDMGETGDLPFAVQVTFFGCGGMALGACLCHKLSDGLRLIYFINCWAAMAAGARKNLISPRFDLSELFPPRDVPELRLDLSKEKIAAKRFVFSAAAISALKARYCTSSAASGDENEDEEAIAAFIWSRIVSANPGRRIMVTHLADLQPLLNPVPPEFYFGNMIGFALVMPEMDASAEGGRGFVRQKREAMKRVDGEYVKSLQKAGPKLQMGSSSGAGGVKREEVVSLTFVSIRRLPAYESDFGWGRPVWVCMAKQRLINNVVFFPSRAGDDVVEALIQLKEGDMAKLENDKEWLAFVSPTPPTRFQLLSSL